MKSFKIIGLLCFYLMASVGFSAHIHYCGGDVADVTLLGLLGENECGCGSEMEKGCCTQESYRYKVDTEHLHKANNPAEQITIALPSLKPIPVPGLTFRAIRQSFRVTNKYLKIDPGELDLSVMYCVFLI